MSCLSVDVIEKDVTAVNNVTGGYNLCKVTFHYIKKSMCILNSTFFIDKRNERGYFEVSL